MILNKNFATIFIVIILHQPVISEVECLGRMGCCDGYYFDEKFKNCTKCQDGFIGPTCKSPCPYPGYGFKCNLTCVCSKEFCNITRGCPKNCKNILNCSASSTVYKGLKSTNPPTDKLEEKKDGTTKETIVNLHTPTETLSSKIHSTNDYILIVIYTLGSVCALSVFLYVSMHFTKSWTSIFRQRNTSDIFINIDHSNNVNENNIIQISDEL